MIEVLIDGVKYVPKIESLPPLEFNKMLIKHRKKQGLTLEQASNLVGCSKSFFWEMENSKCNPGREILGMLHLNMRIPSTDLLLAT